MQQILVTAGVMIENGQVLMAQRLPKGREGGKWEFPGGKVEPGEDPRTCLQRELQEELAVEVEVNEVLEVISENQEDKQLVLLYFRCAIQNGTPQPIECQKVGWLDPGQVDSLEKPPADELFWNKIRKSILVELG